MRIGSWELVTSSVRLGLWGLAAVALLATGVTAEAKRGKRGKDKPADETTVVWDENGGGVVMGRLAEGDTTLDSGEFFDVHSLEVQAGQPLTVDLYSADFDTFLTVISPTGNPTRNDDHEGAKNHSKVDMVADATGTWQVVVTTYRTGEQGGYSMHVQLGPPSAGAPDGAVASTKGPGTVSGQLLPGDVQLETGEFFDLEQVQLQAGQSLTVDLRSTEFDTYLTVIAPRGAVTQNDDYEGSKDHSRIELVADESGLWGMGSTSYQPGESGTYQLEVAITSPTAAGTGGEEAVERHTGRLETGDATLPTGEFVDSFEFEGREGEFVVVDLRSTAFDPWLEVRPPEGDTFVNDDHEGDSTRSLLALTLPRTGTYTAFVTTYRAGDAGGYDLAIQRSAAEAPPTGDVVQERGSLAEGDQQLDSGEFVETYTFEGRPGQRVTIDLEALTFDGYLVFLTPAGESQHNDDAPGEAGHSRIEAALGELGTYTVVVTSFKAGETGDYTLTVALTEDGGYSRQRDANTLAPGAPVSGALEEGDAQLTGGEFVDIYVFEGTAGQQLTVDLTSTAFDPFLGVELPSGGDPIANDDFEGRRDMARVVFQLQESGRYRVLVTSYAGGEGGAYELKLDLAEGGTTPVRPTGAGGRIYGVFVGIGDYPGDADDLPYTAEDAGLLQSAFLRGAGMAAEDSVVLTDAAATVQAVREAVADMGSRAGADDTFVFFYSGHGSRHKRADAPMTDPDGMDETLMLYDGHVTDDEFAVLLDGVGARTTLLLLDACFAGGFSKDVISKPGRMGMFSSEEDVTSGVASKFRAGGYLARFVSDAIGDGLADDGDGGLTALELCQYVHERYRADVKSGGKGDVSGIVLMGREHGYQHLVVDRGSIGPYQVLFGVKK